MQGLELPGGMQVKQVALSPVEQAQIQAAQATQLYIEVKLRMLAGWTFDECAADLGLKIPEKPEA